jgi:hypothetical protein
MALGLYLDSESTSGIRICQGAGIELEKFHKELTSRTRICCKSHRDLDGDILLSNSLWTSRLLIKRAYRLSGLKAPVPRLVNGAGQGHHDLRNLLRFIVEEFRRTSITTLSPPLFPWLQAKWHRINGIDVNRHRHRNPQQNTPCQENKRAAHTNEQQSDGRNQKRNSPPEIGVRLRISDHLFTCRTLIASSCSLDAS